MNLVSIGISHLTAGVEVRERMWLSDEEIRRAVAALKEKFFSEVMLVSTCNRTELYGLNGVAPVEPEALKEFLIDFKGAGDTVKPAHFYGSSAEESVRHLFKVASGVDSQVIGDIQILNQVKEAFNLAREVSTMGPVMHRLMQATLHVGKRTRTETTICEGAVSASYAAVELASKIFADLSKKSAFLIGAGETGELTMKHLVGKGIGKVLIANRTKEKAEALTRDFGGTVIDYEKIEDALRIVDIVITSVNSPSYVVLPDHVHKVMKQRANNPLFIIDIGVPRNVDPSSRRIENVFLYDIDALSSIVDRNLERRKAELPRVEEIVSEETREFFHWIENLSVGPTIQEFRSSLESIRLEEVEKNINRFKPEDRELLDLVTKRIVNKILHTPTAVLKQSGGDNDSESLTRIKSLRELFGMEREKDQDDR
ncbi:MAG: glutamyl-tRNA reductase [Bacteroidota bacterium]